MKIRELKWYTVGEKYPPPYKDCVVIINDQFCIGQWHNANWYINGVYVDAYYSPTHWAELPSVRDIAASDSF